MKIGAQKYAFGQSIIQIHGGEDTHKVLRKKQNRVQTINACGQALKSFSSDGSDKLNVIYSRCIVYLV